MPGEMTEILTAVEKGALVLTVNQRLARYLVQAYDRRQQERGRVAWTAPTIAFYRNWQWQTAARLRLTDKALTPPQALRLWERAVEDQEAKLGGSGLMRLAEAARGAARAHQLLCE